ncbi:LuxR C-terminal-related transcriptional regulator [Serratia symbiotica]|nr:LuxR C-terminal-related transcriptional regulator [Serratia symbiotica]USS96857.1 LuxR C-terminal-related transcriptional regulator [Serratia symbiotica]
MSVCTIANMLHRSQKTISTHKRSAMRKLNLRKNAELSRVLLNQIGLNGSAGIMIGYPLTHRIALGCGGQRHHSAQYQRCYAHILSTMRKRRSAFDCLCGDGNIAST